MIDSKTVDAAQIEHAVDMIRREIATSRQVSPESGKTMRSEIIGRLTVIRDLELVDENLLQELTDELFRSVQRTDGSGRTSS